jgi:hypothetical protein
VAAPVVALHVLLGDGVRGAVDGDVDAVSDLLSVALTPFLDLPEALFNGVEIGAVKI